MANTHLPPLTMAASFDCCGTEVWYAMSPSECDARGLNRHVRDSDPGEVVVVLDIGDVSDAPRCDNCERATLDLEWCDDSHGHVEYRCPACAAQAHDPNEGPTASGPRIEATLYRATGRHSWEVAL